VARTETLTGGQRRQRGGQEEREKWYDKFVPVALHRDDDDNAERHRDQRVETEQEPSRLPP
jgi:hypothetical protein